MRCLGKLSYALECEEFSYEVGGLNGYAPDAHEDALMALCRGSRHACRCHINAIQTHFIGKTHLLHQGPLSVISAFSCTLHEQDRRVSRIARSGEADLRLHPEMSV